MPATFIDMSIRIKLFLLIGVMLLLMLVLSLQGLFGQQQQGQALGKSLSDAALAMQAVDASDAAALHFKIQVQEWKNILIRGHDPKDFDRYLKAFEKEHLAVASWLDKCNVAFGKLGIDSAPVTKARDSHEALRKRYLDAIKQFDSKIPLSYQLVDKAVRGIDRQPTEEIDRLSALVATAIVKRFDAARAEASSREMLALGVSLTVLAIAIVVSILLAGLLIRSITRQLRQAVATADSVADGDLTVKVVSESKDEVGQLLNRLGIMTTNLSGIVSSVRDGSHEIAAAAQQIASATMALSARTEEQASAIEETSSTMEQMTATVRQNNDHTQHVTSIMQKASGAADKGNGAMLAVVQSMQSISAGSKRIGEIIRVIDSIAFQTNILALNAAVEAARAGEHGRGFAVVATEVRALSQRSATAAREIKELIEDAVSRVETGDQYVRDANLAMAEILDDVQSASQLLSEISTTTREQTTGIEQVSTTIVQMEQVTQENAAMVEQASAAAQSLSEQAERFLRIIAQFKLDEAAASGAPAAMGRPRGGRELPFGPTNRTGPSRLPPQRGRLNLAR